MELITKNYFYTIVPSDNKDWYTYRIFLKDFRISQQVYGLNYILIDDSIPGAYISTLNQLIIPKAFGELSEDRLNQLGFEDLTIDTWEIVELVGDKKPCILTRNEITRIPLNDDLVEEMKMLPNISFTLRSTLDTSFKEELVQIVDNPNKYSYVKKFICNSCIKTNIIPEDFWVNYLYNIITLIINLKYIKDVNVSKRND